MVFLGGNATFYESDVRNFAYANKVAISLIQGRSFIIDNKEGYSHNNIWKAVDYIIQINEKNEISALKNRTGRIGDRFNI